MSTANEFNFDASVLGLGGYYVRDGQQTLVPSLASVVLAPSGGEGWSSVENYDTPDIGFTRAESRVRGYETSKNFFTTISDIYITNLRLFDMVRIALLQATVTSTRDLTVASDESDFHLHALYRGIDIDGGAVAPAVDVEVCKDKYDTLRVKKNVEIDAANTTALATLGAGAVMRPLVTDGDPVRSTVLQKFEQTPADSVVHGKHMLEVPGFANIHFGELLAKRGRRRVSLLRLDFKQLMAMKGGGGNSGSITIASVGGNGDPIWPSP